MPNDTTTAVQHPPKAHLGLPATSWLRPSSVDKHSCPYVGQRSSPTPPRQFHHDPRSTTFQQPRHHHQCIFKQTTHHASRVTPPIAHATCRNLDHTRNVYSSTTVTRKTEASTPDMLCPNRAAAMNRELWLRQVLSALCAELPSQKKTRNSKFR